MSIQWYPGHMNQLKQSLKGVLPLIDVVLEIADARAPLSSRNPMLPEILGKKPRLLLLNKSELADPLMLAQWQSYFDKHERLKTLSISAKNRKNLDRIKGEVRNLAKTKNHVQQTNPRVLIIGVPNCGKSTIINALARTHKAKAANTPGVTRQVTRYTLAGLDLYDSPGLLWPNLSDQLGAARLAILAAVRDEVYHPSEAFSLLYPFFMEHYASHFTNRYKIEPQESGDHYLEALMEQQRKSDIEATALSILHDLRAGKLMPFCLESPNA